MGLAASLLAIPASGCGEPPFTEPTREKPTVPGVDASVAFAVKGPLKLAPGETALLAVVTTPPGRYALQFRLVGESLDGSLDTAKAVADEAGVVMLSLRAPNQPTTFAVRATLEDGPSADLVVSVSGQGYATLDVVPDYTGTRPVESWVASAVAGATCDALAKTLPDDPQGALGVTAPKGAALLVPDAPIGPALAVVVRASRYAWGCTDVSGLMAGSVTKVAVKVTDRAIDTSASELDVALELAPDPASWDALLATHRAAMVARFAAEGTEATTLLHAMVKAAPSPNAALAAATSHGWLAALEARLATTNASPAVTLADLTALEPPSLPPIAGHAKSLDPTHALFTLDSVGPLAAENSGGPTEYLLKLTVAPNDHVHLGGALFLLPSRYVGASLEAAAPGLHPPATSVADVLAARVACDTLDLAGLPDCDGPCIADLCRSGLASLWKSALDVSAELGLPAQLTLTATGPASYDADARLLGFAGSWLGQATCGASTVKLGGEAIAKPVENPDAD